MLSTIAWILLLISGLGALLLIMARLPKSNETSVSRNRLVLATDSFLEYFWLKLKRFLNWIWHFVLEAKDIRPAKTVSQQVGRVKNVFRIRIKESDKDPDFMPEVSEQVSVPPQEQEHKTPEALYLEAIKKNPNSKQAYEGLGRLYLQEKNYKDAVEIFKFLTRADNRRDVYWSNLGVSLYSTKDFVGAAQAYEQALNLNDKVPTRWMNLALCFVHMDQPSRAIKAMTKALHLAPRNTAYLMMLADAYISIDNKVRAEEVLTQILALEPTNQQARTKLMQAKS